MRLEDWPRDEFLQCEVDGIPEPSGRGNYYGPDAALIAAASPDVVASLARIALAAVECDLTLSRVIHELAGAASLCWEPKPTGVFDSSLAINFCEKAIDELRAILRDGGLRDAGLLP